MQSEVQTTELKEMHPCENFSSSRRKPSEHYGKMTEFWKNWKSRGNWGCKLSAKTLLSTIQTIATAWSQYNNASYCLPFTQSSIETGELGSLEDSCLTYRQLN